LLIAGATRSQTDGLHYNVRGLQTVIISRTPFRISFFGGGTDYPDWYREHGGAVLATTIDKYCYLSVRELPPFFEHRFRLVYSIVENVQTIDQITHPAVRAVLQWMNVSQGLEIHHDGDLPARAGLGSSSAFTVGLINAMRALSGQHTSKDQLAHDAIHVEQDLLHEPVGSQDQISAAFGGLNQITFLADGAFRVDPIILLPARRDELQSHLLLVFTGISRISSHAAQGQIDNLKRRTGELSAMREMVDQAIGLLSSPTADIIEFGKLVNEQWQLKRRLSDRVSNGTIDDVYEAATRAGAIGGKLLGAGGGGFMLFFVRPQDRNKVAEALKGLVKVPFRFETSGSRIVLYQPDGL
jgi:D-glycero-alpha-D-manno-heptose-7-phosphate kinase